MHITNEKTHREERGATSADDYAEDNRATHVLLLGDETNLTGRSQGNRDEKKQEIDEGKGVVTGEG